MRRRISNIYAPKKLDRFDFVYGLEPSAIETAARHFRLIGNPPTLTEREALSLNSESQHTIGDFCEVWRIYTPAAVTAQRRYAKNQRTLKREYTTRAAHARRMEILWKLMEGPPR